MRRQQHGHEHQPARPPVATPVRRPESPSTVDLAALQRNYGNTAVTRMLAGPPVQRADDDQATSAAAPPYPADALREFVDNWLDNTSVTLRKRSDQLKAIDRAITTWLTGGYRVQGNLDTNQTQLEAIRAAVRAWHDSKAGGSRRQGFIDELATRVDAALAEVARRRVELRERQAQLAKYGRIDPALAGFAERTRREDALNLDTNLVHQAFAADRDDEGRLTEESLTKLDEFARQGLAGALAIVGGVTPNGVTANQVQQIMAANVNAVTGQTIYPELESYLGTVGAQPVLPEERRSQVDTEEVRRTVGQTTLTVHWDPTDVQREPRLRSLTDAIQRVRRGGYVVPPLTVYFPKYGRTLVLSPDNAMPTGAKVHRAEYIAPDTLVASSELFENPLTNRYGGGDYHNLSTQLDPSGAGTMVHELGHFLHYHQNRRAFHDLTGTGFAAGQEDVAASVSGYAAQHPREFVAEVFLGMAYGKQFPADVMEMYDGLGGPSPTQAPTTGGTAAAP